MSREGTEKYNDADKGGYNYAEKLALAAQGMMDPKEIGMTSQEDAIKAITGEEKPSPKAGDFITFHASTIPNEVRARWARSELKVIPQDFAADEFEQKWVEERDGIEFAVQGEMHCGTLFTQMRQLYRDPILGFAHMLRHAADLLETKYNELKATDPNCILSRTGKPLVVKTGAAPAPETSDKQGS